MNTTPARASSGLPALPRRPAAGHKGTFGRVAIVGGLGGLQWGGLSVVTGGVKDGVRAGDGGCPCCDTGDCRGE